MGHNNASDRNVIQPIGLGSQFLNAARDNWKSLVSLFILTVALIWISSIDSGNLSGPIGVAVSSLGVILAILIFSRQKIDGQKSEQAIIDHIDTLKSAAAAEAVSGDPLISINDPGNTIAVESDQMNGGSPGLPDKLPDHDSGGGLNDADNLDIDPYEDSMRKFLSGADKLTLPTGEEVPVGTVREIPMTVLADFINAWPNDGVEEIPRVSELAGVARNTGKGNHPWIFMVARESGVDELWKLTKGGRGASDPRVTKVIK